jgi:hypothetical protein
VHFCVFYALRQLDGSYIIVIQDYMDVTIGVVIQTVTCLVSPCLPMGPYAPVLRASRRPVVRLACH